MFKPYESKNYFKSKSYSWLYSEFVAKIIKYYVDNVCLNCTF